MGRLPLLSGRKLIKILGRISYREVRQRGSHIRLQHPSRKSITVPDYHTIDRTLLRKILRDAELSVDEFEKII